MRWIDILRLARQALLQNRLRSALTATGVAVGVFALITIVALGRGLERALVEQLTDDESQTQIVVRPGFGPTPDLREAEVDGIADPAKADRIRKSIAKRRRGGPGQMRRNLLTREALGKLAGVEHVVAVRPFATDRFRLQGAEQDLDGALSYSVRADDPRWKARVILGQPFDPAARGVWIHEYRLFSWGYLSDPEQREWVGKTVRLSRPREGPGLAGLLDGARQLGLDLPGLDGPEGQRLVALLSGARLPGASGEPPGELAVELPVLGVVRERVDEDGFEVWEDSFSMQADLFFPQALAEELYEQVPSNLARGYDAVAVEVDEARHVPRVEQALRRAGYRTASVSSMLERIELALILVTTVVTALTAIALFVAAIGIVNTMVMNVSERTREIGVLKALGASDAQVRFLFLTESALIGLVGGAAGLVAALLASIPGDWAQRRAAVELTQYRSPDSVFSYPLWLIAVALGFAVLTAVVAALGPARRASRIDPVAALRDE